MTPRETTFTQLSTFSALKFSTSARHIALAPEYSLLNQFLRHVRIPMRDLPRDLGIGLFSEVRRIRVSIDFTRVLEKVRRIPRISDLSVLEGLFFGGTLETAPERA